MRKQTGPPRKPVLAVCRSAPPPSVILALVAGIQPRRVRAVKGPFQPGQQKGFTRRRPGAPVTSTGMTEDGNTLKKQRAAA